MFFFCNSNCIYVAHKSVPTGSINRLPEIVPDDVRLLTVEFPEIVNADPVIALETLRDARLAFDPLVISFFQLGIIH